MKRNALISVIVPVYNVETKISNMIESVICQDYENWELILINDGSIDTSGQICANYTRIDSRIQVIHQNNSGVTKARSVGIENSRGEWVMFVDGDDYIENNTLSELYNLAIKNSADIVFTPYIIDNEGSQVHCTLNAHGKYHKQQYLWLLSNCNVPVGIGGKLMNKSLFNERTFDISSQITHNEDLLMNFKLTKNLKAVYCESRKGYYHYVQHPNSTTHRAPKPGNWIELYNALKAINLGRPIINYIINSIDERFERGELVHKFWLDELDKVEWTIFLPIHTHFNYLYVKHPNKVLYYFAKVTTKLSKYKSYLFSTIRYYLDRVK